MSDGKRWEETLFNKVEQQRWCLRVTGARMDRWDQADEGSGGRIRRERGPYRSCLITFNFTSKQAHNYSLRTVPRMRRNCGPNTDLAILGGRDSEEEVNEGLRGADGLDCPGRTGSLACSTT